MRILAFTDIHASPSALKIIKEKAAKADLIVCCGDFTNFEAGLSKIMRKMDDFGKKVLIVHGNHESEEKVEAECRKSKNLVFLHKNSYEQNGLIFFGYGGGGFSQEDPDFVTYSKKVKAHLDNNKGKLHAFAFHMPPHNTKADKLANSHVGSKSYADYIRKHQPILVLCGHIEENNNIRDRIGNSIIVNPGPDGTIIRLESKIKQ